MTKEKRKNAGISRSAESVLAQEREWPLMYEMRPTIVAGKWRESWKSPSRSGILFCCCRQTYLRIVRTFLVFAFDASIAEFLCLRLHRTPFTIYFILLCVRCECFLCVTLNSLSLNLWLCVVLTPLPSFKSLSFTLSLMSNISDDDGFEPFILFVVIHN